MFRWSAFPFIRIALCLSAGVVLYAHQPQWWQAAVPVGALWLVLLLLVWYFFRSSIVFGLTCLLGLVFLGGCLTQMHVHHSRPGHYTTLQRTSGFIGTIVSDHTERKNYFRYDVAVQAAVVDDSLRPTFGKIHLYIRKDSLSDVLRYGDVVAVERGFFAVSSPKNPEEFDYRAYLHKQNIYHHAFASRAEMRLLDHDPPNPLLALAYRIRLVAAAQIDQHVTWPREHAIITALLLGIKDHLDEDTKKDYAAAGAMHVLAVSGLHVGIVYLLILGLFGKLKQTSSGKLLFATLTIVLIWMYALVTGFSPSVIRAATMFSVIILSDAFRRKANIYNSLGLAATVLILYDPWIVYSVGFQLSFAAVLGIVVLHRRLYHLLYFQNKIKDYIWSITCVSLAAQAATFPLTLLYFHQFPTYFLLSNLVVIPAATVMLFGGVFMLVVGSLWSAAGMVLGYALQSFTWLVNESIGLVRVMPFPMFDWLYFDAMDTVLVYLLVVFLIVALVQYSYPVLWLAGITLLCWIGWWQWKDWHQWQQHQLVVYELDGFTGLDLVQGKEAVLLLDSAAASNWEVVAYQVNPFRLANGLPKADLSREWLQTSSWVRSTPVGRMLTWEGKRVFFPERNIANEMELAEPIVADVLYLPNMEQWQADRFRAPVILAGGGFRYSDLMRLRNEVPEGTLVHSLPEDGYWSLDLNSTQHP